MRTGRSFFRGFGWSAALAAAVLAGGVGWGKGPEPSKAEREQASQAVQDALLHEVYGLDDDRQRLLEDAAANDPSLAAAHWHQGLVQDGAGQWVRFDDFEFDPKTARHLVEYRDVRKKSLDTTDGNWALANWCLKHDLAEQERAHLFRVLELAPDHPEARARLGFVRVGTEWFSRENALRQQQRHKELQEGLAKWRPILRDIEADLRHRSKQRQEKAAERLAEVREVGAIPAIEDLFMAKGEQEARLGLDVLAGIEGEEATLALCRHGLFSPWEAIREAAADKLSERDFHEFVPELLEMLHKPIESRFVSITLPNGRINYQHAFLREGQGRRDVMVLNTEYSRVALPGGDGRASTRRAMTDAAQAAAERELVAQEQNRLTKRANERIMWLLGRATGKAFADPEAWWDWWNQDNDIVMTGQKNLRYSQRNEQRRVVDYVPPPPQYQPTARPAKKATQPARPISAFAQRQRNTLARFGRNVDCFVAGTPVWTAEGQKAIETIQVGDLLLAKDIETGMLTFKPALSTTIRPPSDLLKIGVGKESFEVSSGHLFWVSGDGWTRARDLQTGTVLHGAEGPLRVTSFGAANPAETYSVVVADFNNYFVGDTKVLSHDVTLREPTQAIVPGLRIE